MKASKLQLHIYGLKFENKFLRSNGIEFEELFKTVMKHRFGSDFVSVRPYGKIGDRKLDGYLRSEKTVFQCYAPTRVVQHRLLAKITEDFVGAKEYWKDDMTRWRLVHNQTSDLPPDAIKKFLELQTMHKAVSIDELRYEEFRSLTLELDLERLEDIFGVVPTERSLDNLNSEELNKVIENISQKDTPAKPTLSIPTKEKLSWNQLSQDTRGMIEHGRVRSRFVEAYFINHVDPNLGQAIGRSFREEYLALKKQNHTPNQIFRELQEFAGGMAGSVQRQTAVLAILTYFFETCDIFENNPKKTSERKIDSSV